MNSSAQPGTKKSVIPPIPRLPWDILAGKVSIPHRSITSEPAPAPLAIPDSGHSSMVPLSPQLGFYCRSISRLGVGEPSLKPPAALETLPAAFPRA